MFAYILTARETEQTEQAEQAAQTAQQAEFFRRFLETPGLLHAYDLQSLEQPGTSYVVAIWEDRAAADRYLQEAALRVEVDQAVPGITREMCEVRAHG